MSRMTTEDRQHLCRLVDSVNEWMWVEGNHDPDLPDGIPGTPCFEIVLDNIVFRHEVETSETRAQVIGHYHPKKRTTITRRRYSGKCFTNNENVFVQILDKNLNVIQEQKVNTKFSVAYFDFNNDGVNNIIDILFLVNIIIESENF